MVSRSRAVGLGCGGLCPSRHRPAECVDPYQTALRGGKRKVGAKPDPTVILGENPGPRSASAERRFSVAAGRSPKHADRRKKAAAPVKKVPPLKKAAAPVKKAPAAVKKAPAKKTAATAKKAPAKKAAG